MRLVVLAGYMHILTPAFLDRFPNAVVNVHPSLLPMFPGANAVEEQIAAGVEISGVTVHIVDEGIDSGPILAQESRRRPHERHAALAARADQGRRAPAAAGGGEGTVRALISTYDKTGLDDVRARPRRARLGARRERRHRRVSRGARPRRRARRDADRLAGDARRPREDAAPAHPRGDPRAARPRRGRRDARRSTRSSRSTSSA